jgi:hypothetical protein
MTIWPARVQEERRLVSIEPYVLIPVGFDISGLIAHLASKARKFWSLEACKERLEKDQHVRLNFNVT